MTTHNLTYPITSYFQPYLNKNFIYAAFVDILSKFSVLNYKINIPEMYLASQSDNSFKKSAIFACKMNLL